MKAVYIKHNLKFRFSAGTSRGILKNKMSYFVILTDDNGESGIGECSVLPGLSEDDRPGFEKKLNEVCAGFTAKVSLAFDDLSSYLDEVIGYDWPSIRFGIETGFMDLMNGGRKIIFRNRFYNGEGIPINGLIWMGEEAFMREQIDRKISEGYSCLKMKIGALDFDRELKILQDTRSRFPENRIRLRVDANGAFSPGDAIEKLDAMADLGIHSIEQPIRTGQWKDMYRLCRESPVPIGLDEELIGIHVRDKKQEVLENIRPQYLVLKPSLLGGYAATQEWIDLAEKMNIGWWITSALESNIGLNAICQFTSKHKVNTEQGLGTGQLFSNNVVSPLRVRSGMIFYDRMKGWDLSVLGVEGI